MNVSRQNWVRGGTMIPYQQLKDRHRKERDSYAQHFDIRVHRALSWLQRAEKCEDADGQVVFLWIAFNAAYANEIDLRYRPREQELIYLFLERLCDLDGKKRLEKLLWEEFSNSIRVLLNNKYVFQPFWDYLNDKIAEDEWLQSFSKANAAAHRALGKRNAVKALAIVLSRVYTLRNQIVHGGSTWNSSVNRDQIRDCSAFMGCLVPVVIEIMMGNQNQFMGRPCYPVVTD